MARSKEFDVDEVVEAAVPVFREHGFKGTSAQMLVDAMGIGRQSLYDTFGDKWGIYHAAVKLYSQREADRHIEALTNCERAIDGIEAMLFRVVADADHTCLGLNSTVEFGCSHLDLVKIREDVNMRLANHVKKSLITAQSQGDISNDLNLDHFALFVMSMIATLRLAARSGSSKDEISGIVYIALRTLR